MHALQSRGVTKDIYIIGNSAMYLCDNKINRKKKLLDIILGVANDRVWGGDEKKVASVMISFLKEML